MKKRRAWFDSALFPLVVPDLLPLPQLLDEYFRHASEGLMTNFVQTRGFDLLANQLKRHSVSAELLSALFSIALGGTVALPAARLEGGGARVRCVCAIIVFTIGCILPIGQPSPPCTP